MLPREKIEAEIAYLEIVGRKDGRLPGREPSSRATGHARAFFES
jgi:hypothetical protein